MKKFTVAFLLSVFCAVQLMSARADTPLAQGWGQLAYELPAIGSYTLPPLGQAADGTVLDSNGTERRLHDLFANRYVLLAFVYSSCSDINGCPLTAHVFYNIKTAMEQDPRLASNLTLISLSFDPAVDTPEVMALYGNNFSHAGSAGEWQFVTTSSEHALKPLLAEYGQEIQREYSLNGAATSEYSHVLRVFLIDRQQRIRNIYSAAFLHKQLLVNDFYTLMAEESLQAGSAEKAGMQVAPLSRPGDDKTGYENSSYQTYSQSIESRRGKKADLLSLIHSPPLGLPEVPVPKENPVTANKIELGRKLFFDRRLSLNDTFSCAMCHVPEQGFISNGIATAVGIEGRSVRRNSPTIYNSAYASVLFHDGREDTLEQQVWGPLLARNEMGNPSVGYVVNKIRNIADYNGLFEQVFDGEGVSMQTLGQAMATYQRAVISADSPFDRWYYGDDKQALSAAAQRGFTLFSGKARCIACHTVGSESALFTDNNLHNTGIGYRESMGIVSKVTSVQLAPGVVVDVDNDIIERVGEKPAPDVGLYEVTQNPSDRWSYKTPSLRNVALTAPYMHNGSLSTLRDVVEFYNAGGVANELLDEQIVPLNLNEQDIDDIVVFMESLTGSNVDVLVADAFAAPVGDIKSGDPVWVHGTQWEVE